MSLDLNIIERGLSSYEWNPQKGVITDSELDGLKEQQTNNSSALNALPTPFARFFVCREAYRRVLEERNSKITGKGQAAGDAYKRLVSDSLDILELLYNLKFHENHWSSTRKLYIQEWNAAQDLNALIEKVPVLGEALRDYLVSDLGEGGKRMFFVVLEVEGKKYLLGTSSPMTAFVTPPDLDKKTSDSPTKVEYVGAAYKNLPLLSRKNGRSFYFRDIVLFENRDKDFKNYLFNQVNNGNLGDSLKVFRDYIKSFATDIDIVNNWDARTEDILSENSNELTIGGLKIKKDAGLSTVNFFSESLIRLPYKISNKEYRTVEIIGEQSAEQFDFLMPIRKEALSLLPDNFKCTAKLKRGDQVTITLSYNGHEYEKDYYPAEEAGDGKARIFNLQRSNVNFNIACFPNIKSSVATENNYFKIMVAIADENKEYRYVDIKDINLEFFSLDENNYYAKIDDAVPGDTYGVLPAVIRSKQDDESCKCGTKFYEIFNTSFDAITVGVNMGSGMAEGVLIKKWNEAQATSNSYTYAIDLGTSNTYISSHLNGSTDAPIQLKMDKPMVSYMHEYTGKANRSIAANIESTMFESGKKRFMTEFVPPCIDGALYSFPIRTALCKPTNSTRVPKLFDNHNIAFFYEKRKEAGLQEILTNIKWDDRGGSQLRLFIRELLLIIKADILHKDANLSLTKLVWFRPLSFMGTMRQLFDNIWHEEAKNILNIPASSINCYSESEAPYYYFDKARVFKSINSVTVVDIGGGSTDFVYFKDSKPILANSVHFGCDTLWGNGFGFGNTKDNGIFKKYETIIQFSEDKELDAINISMKENANTKDIINFWISNSDKCGIREHLSKEYKPLFLYHFTAIMFYMANMFKAKGVESPRTIVFSGNGSRYIDNYLVSDKALLAEMVTDVFKSVYGDVEPIQVLLPEERKESTCYGGLYRDENAPVPDEYIFQGVDSSQYKDIDDLKTNFSQAALVKKIHEMNYLYKQLLSKLANKQVMERINTDALYAKVEEGLADSLETTMKQEVIQKYNKDDLYHDSLYFLPIINNILKLTTLE